MALDVATQKATPLVNNWGQLAFNSPNDVAVHGPSGALLFTDPDYGYAHSHRPPPQLGTWVWRYDPATATVTPVADGFVKPNGVTFSPDFSTCYVTESGCLDGAKDDSTPQSFVRAMPAIYAFDVVSDAGGLPTLRNRRLFAASPAGYADGIKVRWLLQAECAWAGACSSPATTLTAQCLLPSAPPLQIDERGNVWAAGPPGVEVWSPTGQHLGTLLLGSIANIAFAGHRLIMMQKTQVTALATKVAGNPLLMTGAAAD